MSNKRTRFSSPRSSGLHTERLLPGQIGWTDSRIHPVQGYYGEVHAAQEKDLKCACGNVALNKKWDNRAKKLIGYCRKCKPTGGAA